VLRDFRLFRWGNYSLSGTDLLPGAPDHVRRAESSMALAPDGSDDRSAELWGKRFRRSSKEGFSLN